MESGEGDDGQQVHGEPGFQVVLGNLSEAVLPLNAPRRGVGVHGEELDHHVLGGRGFGMLGVM